MFHAHTDEGLGVHYRDRKRYLWLVATSGPFVPVGSIALYLSSGLEAVLLLPIIYSYFLIPFVDAWLGEDEDNPPEAIVPALASDPYYHTILCVHIVLLWGSFGFAVFCAASFELSWWAHVGLAIGVGLSSVDALVVGHELGHKRGRVAQAFARLGLVLVAYGHFRIEHNRGHHRDVATPEDSASARMGESVYAFACRELPGALRRGWRLECERLARRGRPVFSLSNEVLVSWCASGAIALGLTLAFGPAMGLFLLLHHAQAWYGLTQANYVEHYGLLRAKGANGQYEPPAPRHSWNTNHIFSNLLTFHLQRHSDHHAHATRPYQALRNFDDLPRLPNGYPGCFGLAAIPSVWFSVMDPKLVEWAGGDLSKLNIDPNKRAEIEARYGGGASTTEDDPS